MSSMQDFMPEGFFENSMGWTNAVGYLAAAFSIASYSMKMIIHLRVAAIISSIFFLAYGFLAPSYPQIILNAVLVPLNIVRLRQMITLIDDVKSSSDGSLAMNWLAEYGHRRNYKSGEIVFSKGAPADTMYYTVSGRYALSELQIEIEPGEIIGEIGIVAPDNLRTQTFECIESGKMLSIKYDRVKELYFQNPRFGFYFLDLIAKRLIANNADLQLKLEQAQRNSSPVKKRKIA